MADNIMVPQPNPVSIQTTQKQTTLPEFYTNYLQEQEQKQNQEQEQEQEQNPINLEILLKNHPIKHTKLYWLLSRCLTEDPKTRSIIFI